MISAKAAIDYNNACNYPSNLINVILRTVRGAMGWQWNEPGVTAIAKWQESNKLLADGMVGKRSLEKLISELASCGKPADADSLRQFLAKAKAAQAPKPKTTDIVAGFPPPRLVYPFRFEKEKTWDRQKGKMVPSWAARGTFEVQVKLNPGLSEEERLRYEYRQFIKGMGWVQDGQWGANNVWTPSHSPVFISSRFAVPPDPIRDPIPGLTSNFKEDGKFAESPGGEHFRFGRRNGQVYDGNRFKNKWSPNEISGPNLVLRDTPGYGSVYDPRFSPKVHMEFTFCGVIVEVEEVVNSAGDYETKIVREIESKFWSYRFEDILKWDKTPNAIL